MKNVREVGIFVYLFIGEKLNEAIFYIAEMQFHTIMMQMSEGMRTSSFILFGLNRVNVLTTFLYLEPCVKC